MLRAWEKQSLETAATINVRAGALRPIRLDACRLIWRGALAAEGSKTERSESPCRTLTKYANTSRRVSKSFGVRFHQYPYTPISGYHVLIHRQPEISFGVWPLMQQIAAGAMMHPCRHTDLKTSPSIPDTPSVELSRNGVSAYFELFWGVVYSCGVIHRYTTSGVLP